MIADKFIQGHNNFKQKYVSDSCNVMAKLHDGGQNPDMMVISCCDSRVDPGTIFQCTPGEIFVLRNVGSIIPPYNTQDNTCAALEFGIRYLKIKHLMILGHSQCSGMQLLLDGPHNQDNDFISHWVSTIKIDNFQGTCVNECTKYAISQSYQNCLTFPWIKSRILQKSLEIHLCFFDINTGSVLQYNPISQQYETMNDK